MTQGEEKSNLAGITSSFFPGLRLPLLENFYNDVALQLSAASPSAGNPPFFLLRQLEYQIYLNNEQNGQSQLTPPCLMFGNLPFGEKEAYYSTLKNLVQVIKLNGDAEEPNAAYLRVSPLGIDLYEYYKLGKLDSFEKKLLMAKALAQKLIGLHKLGIRHGDLAMVNILVMADNPFNIQLIDFDRAVIEGTLNPDKGSVYIFAPEQRLNFFATTKSDVWAFGVLMYEMFCGKHFPTRNIPGDDYSKIAAHFAAFAQEGGSYLKNIDVTSCPNNNGLIYSLLAGVFQYNPEHRLTMEQVLELLNKVP